MAKVNGLEVVADALIGGDLKANGSVTVSSVAKIWYDTTDGKLKVTIGSTNYEITLTQL